MQLSILYTIAFVLAGVQGYPSLAPREACIDSNCEQLKQRNTHNNDYDWHKRDGELEKRIVLQCKYKKTCCCPNGGKQCMKCVVPGGCTFTCN